MKKQFFLLIMAFSLTVFVGCDYDDEFMPPNYATLDKTAYTVNVNEAGNSTMNVTVYTSNITNADRTFTINVAPASTVPASAITIPATVTVPAGSNEATFTVGISDSNLSNAIDGNKLVFRLGEEAGLTTADASTITVNRICPFDIAGEYMLTMGASTTPRPVTIVAGTAPNQYIAKNLYQDGFDVTFTVNPAFPNTLTLALQPGYVDATFGPANVTALAGSRVEACDKRIRISISRRVAAGTFGARTDILRKVVQ